MNNNNTEQIQRIDIESMIWLIYIVIIFLALLSNYLEKNSIINNIPNDKTKSRNINIFIFTVLLIIYLYFLIDSYKEYKKEPSNNNYINLLANILNTISGIMFLYVAIVNGTIEPTIDI